MVANCHQDGLEVEEGGSLRVKVVAHFASPGSAAKAG